MQIKLDFLGESELKIENIGNTQIIKTGSSIIELRNGHYTIKITAPFDCEKIIYHVQKGQMVKKDDVIATLIKSDLEFKTLLDYDKNHLVYNKENSLNVISKEIRFSVSEGIFEIINIVNKKSFKKDEVIFEAEDDKSIIEFVAPYDIDSIDIKVNVRDVIQKDTLLCIAKIYNKKE